VPVVRWLAANMSRVRLYPPLALGAAAWSLPALAPLSPLLCRTLRLERRIEAPGGTEVALTFDDGPHPQGTASMLATLDAAGARATFFLVGEQVERRPGLAAEIAAAGHGIGLHGHRHRNQLRLTPAQVAADVERCAVALAEATGRETRLYRPAYGIFSAGGLAALRQRGYEPLLWSRWGRDWSSRATAASITARLTSGLRAGEVLLLHDSDCYSAEGSWRNTAAALPRVLEEVARAGLRPVPLDAAKPAP
jgi:peptidoglycan/xylan/chitin deacetylase (PgdA/CDA1 family)